MAGRVSKNQRAGSIPGGGKTIQIIGDIRLITPLNQGKHARIYNVATGKNPHVLVDSDQFDTQMRDLVDAGYETKIRSELHRLHQQFPDHGWDRAIDRLEALTASGETGDESAPGA